MFTKEQEAIIIRNLRNKSKEIKAKQEEELQKMIHKFGFDRRSDNYYKERLGIIVERV